MTDDRKNLLQKPIVIDIPPDGMDLKSYAEYSNKKIDVMIEDLNFWDRHKAAKDLSRFNAQRITTISQSHVEAIIKLALNKVSLATDLQKKIDLADYMTANQTIQAKLIQQASAARNDLAELLNQTDAEVFRFHKKCQESIIQYQKEGCSAEMIDMMKKNYESLIDNMIRENQKMIRNMMNRCMERFEETMSMCDSNQSN